MPWIERALVSKCHGVVESVTEALLENKFAPPSKALREFLVEDFAAWYLEASKTRLQGHLGGDPSSPQGLVSQRVLLYALEVSLKLLHPFMPFVTEAVWQRLPREAEAEGWFDKTCATVTQIRNTRAKHDIPPK